jgi:hypothetical protein
MKRLFGLALAGLLFLGVFSVPAVAGRDIVKVMTQNQYLGADLGPLIEALQTGNPQAISAAALLVLDQIKANNFPLRAWRFATEVALTKPDLIGLQEVIYIDITLGGPNGGPPDPPPIDHLAVTLAALDAKGQRYVDEAIVNNLDITISIDINGDGAFDDLHVLDRDVILVQEGVIVHTLDGDWKDGGLCGLPLWLPGLPFLQSTQSEDGCNYTVAAQVPPPPLDPAITIKRGFVGVDATVRGKTIRFVNTHLEGTRFGPAIQSLQAVELVETLDELTPHYLPLILVGDFNSSDEDVPIDFIIPPYQIIVGKGFADIWNTNILKFCDPNGFTCCQDKDLLNTTSELDERIDIIFVRDTSFLPLALVTGRVPIYPLSQPPNWVSDHGGVFGKLIFRRGEMDCSFSRKTKRPLHRFQTSSRKRMTD